GELVSAPYATKLLADLGADVVKIEPPAGDRARRRGPCPGGMPHPEKSGLFLYLNTNKRGIVLDLTTPAGHAALERLAERADLLVHNVHPRDMAASGLDYERLSARNPRLVVTSIAPFGLSGPHAGWRGTDVVTWSAGGVAALNGVPGEPDLPPLKTFGDQSGFQAALTAAVGSLGALLARIKRGRGEHVEVSTQECVATILELTFEYWPYTQLVASRLGQKPIQPLCFMECRDGWIFICCVEEHQWKHFVEIMGNPEWAALELFENRLARGGNFDALEVFLQEWCREQSVESLYGAARTARGRPGRRLHVGLGGAVLHAPARAPRRRGDPRRDGDAHLRHAAPAAVRGLQAGPEPERLLQPVQPGEEEPRPRPEASR